MFLKLGRARIVYEPNRHTSVVMRKLMKIDTKLSLNVKFSVNNQFELCAMNFPMLGMNLSIEFS